MGPTLPARLLAGALVLVTGAAGCARSGDDALCAGTEFSTRDDGLIGLEDTYGFDFPTVVNVDDDLVYLAVDKGGCLFGSIFTTDGRVKLLDLVVLEDDENFFPPFNASLNVNAATYQAHPEIEELMAPIAEALTQDTMISLNEQVSDAGESEDTVAEDWLDETGLLDGIDESTLAGATLTVGSKEFTEQNILAYITVGVLQAAGAVVSEEIGLVGSAGIRQAILRGDIDMYWEYLGTGWVTYLGNDSGIPDVDQQYEAVRQADGANGVVWLPPTPFSNTYALAMTASRSEELGITAISDIRSYLDG